MNREVIETGPYKHKSLPQIASQILADFKARVHMPERADEQFREHIADLCNVSPTETQIAELTPVLDRLEPSWVITTNYDLVLETLMEWAVSVLPDQPLVANAKRTPIYHLHGNRLNPASITVTEEDYVKLLAPIDYPRLKLPLVLFESMTLMLGYALGDINVRSAMEWSRSFRRDDRVRRAREQGTVVQALYRPENAGEAPYVGSSGEIVVEISDVAAFLRTIGDARDQQQAALGAAIGRIREFVANPANATAVADEGSPERQMFLDIVTVALPFAQTTRIIQFLSVVLAPIWSRARADGGFAHYATYLSLLIDVLAKIEFADCYPGLIRYLADSLDKVGWYISDRMVRGGAWAASDIWRNRHRRISDALKRELRSYAEANELGGLTNMLDIAR